MELVFIGAGRLATNLALALNDKGHHITAVYSRTIDSARALADRLKAEGQATEPDGSAFEMRFPVVGDLQSLTHDFPLPTGEGLEGGTAIIIAVKDDALPTLACQLAERLPNEGNYPVFHTAGSVPMSVLSPLPHHGVIYPLQTFSIDRRADFTRIPFFIEASDQHTLSVAHTIAASLSNSVNTIDSQQRRQLHLAAVFASNFANHCYTLAADILERSGLHFSSIQPLIEETAAKVATIHPRLAQTGPAVRYDKTVIDWQRQMLADQPMTQQIYELMSESIHQHTQLPNCEL